MRFYEVLNIQREIGKLSAEEFAELRPNPAIVIEPYPKPDTLLRDTTTRVKMQIPAPPPLLHKKAQIVWILPLAPGRWPDVKLGRDSQCDIVFPNPSVSKRHATLSFLDGMWTVEDHGSLNGTEIMGERILRSMPRPLPEAEPLALAQVVVLRAYYAPASLHAMLRAATIGA
ncbi:MAG TPA: FHA domain-containing protein [Planctomycetota bacterium]|nr:FHA domain-containing protein [Planctomycetota bacterium]